MLKSGVVSLTPATILVTVAFRVKLLLRTSFIIIRTKHLSSRNLSNLQLNPSLYEITVSYAAVRLTTGTSLFIPAKIVNDFY